MSACYMSNHTRLFNFENKRLWIHAVTYMYPCFFSYEGKARVKAKWYPSPSSPGHK